MSAQGDAGWIQQLTGVLAVLAWLSGLAWLAVRLRRRWPERREWSRKLVHIGAGLVVLIAWEREISRPIVLTAAVLVTLLAALNHRMRLIPAVEDVDRRSYGTVAYGAAFSLLFGLWWPGRADAVAAGVLAMAFGDGLAGLVGQAVPSPTWSVIGERRSLAGTLTMAAVTLAVLAALALLPAAQPPGGGALLLIALAATAVEQVPLLGLDNLSVPLTVAWLWARLG